MKLNENTRIIGEKVILVPYCKEHVEKYHEWMKSEFLQTMTESEPLTIEQEYEMQQDWYLDEMKSTIEGMCGDVNLFLREDEEEENNNNNSKPLKIAEIEVMIAEESSRRKGIGKEAVELMMQYGKQILGISLFEAKILETNLPSIDLFENKLNYKRIRYQKVFQEYVFQKDNINEMDLIIKPFLIREEKNN
ncbi:hypothetical protein ABK040_005931 [Willaertia magna]